MLYHLILHIQPPPLTLPLSDHGECVFVTCCSVANRPQLRGFKPPPLICVMSLLAGNSRRARLSASSARRGVAGSHSASASGQWVGLEGPGWLHFSVTGQLAGEDGRLFQQVPLIEMPRQGLSSRQSLRVRSQAQRLGAPGDSVAGCGERGFHGLELEPELGPASLSLYSIHQPNPPQIRRRERVPSLHSRNITEFEDNFFCIKTHRGLQNTRRAPRTQHSASSKDAVAHGHSACRQGEEPGCSAE